MRKTRLLLAAVLAATVMSLVPTPAKAHEQVCAGEWLLTLSEGYGYILVTSPKRVTFDLEPMYHHCAPENTWITATGEMGRVGITLQDGHCGWALGHGRALGHNFNLEWIGSKMRLEGPGVSGVLNIVHNPLSNGSCASGTADSFFATGAIIFTSHNP